jgi:pimeloyl-ACP methyl ester carboxylesterase
LLNRLRKQNHVLPVLVFSTGIVLSALSFAIHAMFGVFASLLTIFLSYLELVTQWSFRAPPNRKPPLEDERFERRLINVLNHNIAQYILPGNHDAPVAWICHGWTAGACRMKYRVESFIERGWSVVAVDLPGHGISDGLTKWSAEESTTLLIHAINKLQSDRPELFANGIVYYGHSIGAFIGLRISKRRDQLSDDFTFSGWIMESPMTGYTEIFDETCNILRIPTFLRPLVLRKTLRHFNALNEGVAHFARLDEADAPTWGVPEEQVLLIQAMPDERLGSAHYERLIHILETGPEPNLLSTEFLDDLNHSGSHHSDSRKAAIDAWLDGQFPAHSSASLA